MTLSLLVLIAWVVVIIFAKMPKHISYLDMIFLFCLSLILSTNTFTILDVNLHLVEISRKVEKSFAVITERVITIPLLLIMSANVMHSCMKWYKKLFVVFTILIVLLSFHLLLSRMGALTKHHWKFVFSVLMYTSFALLINLFSWWFVRLGRRKAEND